MNAANGLNETELRIFAHVMAAMDGRDIVGSQRAIARLPFASLGLRDLDIVTILQKTEQDYAIGFSPFTWENSRAQTIERLAEMIAGGTRAQP